MSKTILSQYNEFVQSRKEKLVNMLLSEIIFLKSNLKNTKNKNEISYLENALEKLDFLLNNLKNNSSNISEEEFDKIILLIYQIFKEITEKLE